MPTVSIIGRPNVGKSSLFNRIIQKRHAIVDDIAGVTRDRNYAQASWNGVDFTVVDTGGLIPTSREVIPLEIRRQADAAIKESDAIVFMVEAGTGPTDPDLEIARQLKRTSIRKTVLVVNKTESRQAQFDVHAFNSLGLGEPMSISALHGSGVADLLDHVVEILSTSTKSAVATKSWTEPVKIAILGRPNAGKSSLVNKLLKQQRMIVDSAPGTTRDSIDTLMMFNDRPFVLIDTAGLRKKARVKDEVEYHANLRALESISRADVCAVLVDTFAGMGEQDMTIVQKVLEAHRGLLLCWNKWDLVQKDTKTFDKMVAEARHDYMELRYVPMLSLSALTGQRVTDVLEKSLEIKERMRTRVAPAELREAVFEWVVRHPHPMVGTKPVRVLGVRQHPASYPLFFLFATNAGSGLPSYTRYVANKIHEKFGFEGCPVVIKYKQAARPGRKAREPE